MLCNQAPVLLDSASKNSGHASLNLEHFLSQYLPKNESKFQTIHQTLQKAEAHNFPVNNKSDKSFTSKQVRFDKNLESTAGMSDKSSVTLDLSQKTSLDTSAVMLATLAKHEEVIEDTQNIALNTEKHLRLRKSKSKHERTKAEHSRTKKDRRITTMGFWSPYRSKSPIHTNTFTSFTSDPMNMSQFSHKSHLLIDCEHPVLSDEEENGGFLMIKPITPTISHPKLEQRLRQQNFNLNLDESLFPSEIIDYANSLQEENLGAYVRTLIGYIHSFRNKNKFFATKRPISEALYSIYFQGETFEMFRKLLQQVLTKLKEESITLKQKYRTEIEYIETKHSKIARSTTNSIKFEEKELQKLQAKITNIFQEKCLMDSQSVLSLIHHFLEKILERFPSLDRPNALKPGKGVIIDHITLPKLMENLLDTSDKSASFYRTIVIYTYDAYVTAENLLLYLIQRYFDPEPRHMAASELRVYKAEVQKPFRLNILKIIRFWICERSGDFLRNRDIMTILNTFLDLAKPLEKDRELFGTLNELSQNSEGLSHEITKKKKRICEEVDDLVAPLQSNSFTLNANKQDASLLSRVISVSEGPHLSLNRKDDIPKIKAAQSLTRMDASSDSIAPFILKTDSSTTCQTVKDSKSLSNGSNSSLSGLKMTSIRSEADIKPVRSSLKPVIGNKFRFWTGSNGNKDYYDFKMLLEENSGTIARYLTVIDWKHFAKIDISEMIKKRWTKGDKTECPNYFKYVARFNSFCSWIQYIVLSEENSKKRNEIVEKFLEVAVICLHTYNNYSSSHYIFAALSSLEKFDVISFQESSMSNYGDLKKKFIPSENFLAIHKDIFGNMKSPAIPNLNFFLQSFLKLQDGVVFWIKLPESSKHRYLKFPLVIQINDSCKEMRRFQKGAYENIKIQRGDILYKYLKKGFKNGVPIRLEERDESITQLTKMVIQVKEKQKRQFTFFGTKTMIHKSNTML